MVELCFGDESFAKHKPVSGSVVSLWLQKEVWNQRAAAIAKMKSDKKYFQQQDFCLSLSFFFYVSKGNLGIVYQICILQKHTCSLSCKNRTGLQMESRKLSNALVAVAPKETSSKDGFIQ